MNNAVVVVQPQGNVKNIGDYVQPVAILQFCDSTPEFIDREHLSVYQSKNEERTKGNLFAGSPAVLKATGIYRLLNTSFEMQMKQRFVQSGVKYINESELNDFCFKNYLSRE